MSDDQLIRWPGDDFPDEWHDDARGHVRFATHFSGESTPTDSLTAGRAEVPAGESFRCHRHDPAEVYYILRGAGSVEVGDVHHDVSAGSSVFIPGGHRHGIHNPGDEPLELFYVLAVDSFEDVAYEFLDG